MAIEDVRYGVSMLDMKNKAYAQNDEVLIRGDNAQMFYKREDGQIISQDQDYTKQTLFDNMNTTLQLTELTSTDFLVYNTIDVTGIANLKETSTKALNLGVFFPFSTNENGFYIRIHGNEETNDAVSLIKQMYKNKHGSLPSTADVQIGITLVYGDYQETKIINLSFNELTFVPITTPDVRSIGINSVRVRAIATEFSELTAKENEILNEVNFGNTKFEASCIDFVSFTSNLESVIVKSESNDRVRLNLISDLGSYLAHTIEHNVVPFVLSKEKPNFKCLWAQELTEPEIFENN